MRDNKQTIIIVLLIVNLVVSAGFGIYLRNHFQAKNDSLSLQLQSLNNSLAGLSNSISLQIANALAGQDSLVNDVRYRYTSIDTAKKVAVLEFTVELQAVKPNSQVYLAIREVHAAEVQEVLLAREDSLRYRAEVELALAENFEYDIVERVEGGGEALLNSDKGYIDLYTEFYELRVQMHSGGSGRTQEQMDFDIQFSVDDFGLEEFSLAQVQLDLLHNGERLDSVDITERVTSMSVQRELQDQYNIAIASGQIDLGMSLEDFATSIDYQVKEESRKDYSCSYVIDYADYPELKLDIDSAEAISYKLIVTCKDGYSRSLGN